jgi:hypothetical protein
VEGLESFFQQIDRSMARLGVKSAGGGISGFGAKRSFVEFSAIRNIVLKPEASTARKFRIIV